MREVEQRHVARDSLFVLSNLRLVGEAGDYRVRVRNLSAGGLMAEGQLPVVRGTAVEVDLRNIGWVKGHVAWIQGSRFGIAFDEEIDPKAVRQPPSASEGEEQAGYYQRLSISAAAQNLTPDHRKFRKI